MISVPLGKRIDDHDKNNKLVSGENGNITFKLEEPRYSFDNIILNDETYDSIQDMLSFYENRNLIFDKWGLAESFKQQRRIGVNLYGDPGTGKTMAAHAIAKQISRPILAVDYSQIESKYVGETSKNLKMLFEHAKETDAIIFFDEADALLSKRVTNMSNSTDVSVNQTRSVLLTLTNDFDGLIVFATNFISNYDPAFMRRISMHIKFELPNEKSRMKLWGLYIPKKMPTDVDINELAQKYSNISGSDISNAVFAASLKAARNKDSLVKHQYFEESIERIIESKKENLNENFYRRTVSKDYVKKQFGGELPV